MSNEDSSHLETRKQLIAEQEAEPETELKPLPQTNIETPLPDALPTQDDVIEHELLAEQFQNYLRIAKALTRTLKRPKDIDICSNLILQAERHNNSKHLEVKHNNNRFFSYFLKILNWTSINQPIELYKRWYNRSNDVAIKPIPESRHWLEGNKSYVAMKYLKDGTFICYSAISDNPEAGWQEDGLNILAKLAVYQRN